MLSLPELITLTPDMEGHKSNCLLQLSAEDDKLERQLSFKTVY